MTTDDRGLATVGAIVIIPVLVMVAGISAALGSVVVGRHQATTVADLAAIAGAQGDGCADAERVAEANGMRVAQCDGLGGSVIVQVRAPAPAFLVSVAARLHQEAPDITAWSRADPG